MDKPCKHGHTHGRNKRGDCKECCRLRSAANSRKPSVKASRIKYDHSKKGQQAAARKVSKRWAAESREFGINPEVRRKIEDREILKELELL